MSTSMSFLGLEGLHVFVTGAAGGIGSQAVTVFLSVYFSRRDKVEEISNFQSSCSIAH